MLMILIVIVTERQACFEIIVWELHRFLSYPLSSFLSTLFCFNIRTYQTKKMHIPSRNDKISCTNNQIFEFFKFMHLNHHLIL